MSTLTFLTCSLSSTNDTTAIPPNLFWLNHENCFHFLSWPWGSFKGEGTNSTQAMQIEQIPFSKAGQLYPFGICSKLAGFLDARIWSWASANWRHWFSANPKLSVLQPLICHWINSHPTDGRKAVVVQSSVWASVKALMAESKHRIPPGISVWISISIAGLVVLMMYFMCRGGCWHLPVSPANIFDMSFWIQEQPTRRLLTQSNTLTNCKSDWEILECRSRFCALGDFIYVGPMCAAFGFSSQFWF